MNKDIASLKDLVRRWVEQGWNQGRFDMIATHFSPDYILTDPAAPGSVRGREGFTEFVRGFRDALPDVAVKIESLIGEGDTVCWRFTITGTQMGSLMGLPPSGKYSKVTGIVISRFENGMWREDHVNWDTFGMLRQIGVIPEPASV